MDLISSYCRSSTAQNLAKIDFSRPGRTHRSSLYIYIRHLRQSCTPHAPPTHSRMRFPGASYYQVYYDETIDINGGNVEIGKPHHHLGIISVPRLIRLYSFALSGNYEWQKMVLTGLTAGVSQLTAAQYKQCAATNKQCSSTLAFCDVCSATVCIIYKIISNKSHDRPIERPIDGGLRQPTNYRAIDGREQASERPAVGKKNLKQNLIHTIWKQAKKKPCETKFAEKRGSEKVTETKKSLARSITPLSLYC